MCLPAAGSAVTQLARQRGEAPGGRLRHWEHAALELRRVRRDSTTTGLMFKTMASTIKGASSNFIFKFGDPKFFKKVKLKIMRGLAECWYQLRLTAKV
ncbi:hypothetical protein NDU88_002305 [Pleurodeles waltl]|uniref:Uncharacterized protein n=1 Tax=Pleurodeles waltl TaxID=8319 RepID=A0AAV7WKV0_PLEWA|nr:hypothetical protein NDU88_002305 [Pleurodeles waltl]